MLDFSSNGAKGTGVPARKVGSIPSRSTKSRGNSALVAHPSQRGEGGSIPALPLHSIAECNAYLVGRHYLGPTKIATLGWKDEYGVLLFSNPRSRRLPKDWLELVRWCLNGEKNAGSKQWARFRRWAQRNLPATTIVSYSDPSAGHTGALYRACNWIWAPTWQRLRPPPSGGGKWSDSGKQQAVKDRWVFPLRDDARRAQLLGVNDEALMRRMPWASYPGDYARFKKRES